MPNPNAILSATVRLDPPLDGPPEDILRTEHGLSVVLDDDRRIRLDPADPRSPGFARVVDGARALRLPVYVEFDPATDSLTRLLVARVARVAAVNQSPNGLDIELDPSHGRHVLRLGEPDSPELERQLREAVQDERALIVAEDDAHTILAVRPFVPTPEGPLPPFLQGAPPSPPGAAPKPGPTPARPLGAVGPLQRRIWWWIRWPCWYFRCPSATRAQRVFDALAATSCDPLTVPAPCIPFRYPDDGCWARAHEMCRLMINMGLSPDKVWIDHSAGHQLHVDTANNPQCYVEWNWHVAPRLCVRGPGFLQTRPMVMDPSLFAAPVTEPTWKGVQGDPGAALTHTTAAVYSHGGGTDPTYTDTNYWLAYYRLALQARAVQYGPPPYAACP